MIRLVQSYLAVQISSDLVGVNSGQNQNWLEGIKMNAAKKVDECGKQTPDDKSAYYPFTRLI